MSWKAFIIIINSIIIIIIIIITTMHNASFRPATTWLVKDPRCLVEM